MFRKLVSNLPFSPALIHDVGFYAKRLRNEEVTRRMTVLFTVLALTMQSLTLFSPPESANASSEQDIIPGGVSSLDDFLLRYDHNKDDIKDILSTLGVTKEEIAAAKPDTLKRSSEHYLLTRYGQFAGNNDEAVLSYQRSIGGVATRYLTPSEAIMHKHQSFSGWIGNSESIGWFGIVKNNGSIVTKGIPETISTVGDQALMITKSISATNLSQESINAANTFARPLDKIAYTLTAKNTSDTSAIATFSIHTSDILEYATLIDGGGGTMQADNLALSWPQVRLSPGEVQERTFVVQLPSTLSAMPTGTSNPSSHDCVMNATFGESLPVKVDCPPIKAAESIIGQLPSTGTFINLLFAGTLLGLTVYFYTRTRLLKKEIRIIRHNINTGII